jgi:hypothetical protein
MKKVVLFLFLFGALQVSGQSKDELAIRKLLNSQTIAWNQGDIETFMKGYWENDSLMFIGQSGITYGWNNTLSNYKKNYPDTVSMGKLAFTLLIIKNLSVEYYQVIGKWHLQRSIGNREGHFTLLFRKINGNWVIVSDHSS